MVWADEWGCWVGNNAVGGGEGDADTLSLGPQPAHSPDAQTTVSVQVRSHTPHHNPKVCYSQARVVRYLLTSPWHVVVHSPFFSHTRRFEGRVEIIQMMDA